MKKLFLFALCFLLLAGCVPMGAPAVAGEAATPGPAADGPQVTEGHETPEPSPVPPGEVTVAPVTLAPLDTPRPTATPKRVPTARPTVTPEASPTVKSARTPKPTKTPTPKPTNTPRPTATPKPTTPPDQTYTGTYFKFVVPGSWLKAKTADGVYFYPDADDTRHTFFMYQEAENDMGLTETKMDMALMFSTRDSITAMVEGALTGSGMTNFKLSPVTIRKTKLNGLTCYKGASDITQDGETYDFVGYIFLRGDKLVLFVWVGDQTKHAAGLKKVYDSIQGVK